MRLAMMACLMRVWALRAVESVGYELRATVYKSACDGANGSLVRPQTEGDLMYGVSY